MKKSRAARLAVPVAAAIALAVFFSAWLPVSGRSARAADAPLGRLRLPPPDGRFAVGTVSLHLIDRSRKNPWPATPPYRELMVSVWYPARDAGRYPLAPQMLPGAAAHYGSQDGYGWQGYRVPPGTIDWSATMTSGHVDAPVASAGNSHRFPVVLYSPPLEEPRTWETTLVQDLASRGYIVVTMDPTYEASEVEFPGGRVIASEVPQWFTQAQQDHDVPALMAKILNVRVADTQFVLGQLTALAAGREPDAGRQRLPRGLPGAMDLRRVGMLGVSAGGITTAEAMYSDSRIKAGIDLDGNVDSPLLPAGDFLSPVWRNGLDQPFMFMGDPKTDHNSVPSWHSFWTHTRGWHLDLTLDGASGENSYKDAVPLIPQIARELHLPRSFVTGDIGSIVPAQAIAAEEAYVSAFFDRWLRGHDTGLLDGPSPRYPDITFVK
jgi:platelet-activating factor acetylhydrolase isoform II